MHRALVVSEVLLEIFAYLDPTLLLSWPGKRWLSLAALARTCKTFHEPAMDLLWADVDGMAPLLGCVPRLHPLIYPLGTKCCSGWSQGVEPLSEHEARQFLLHAARVRSISRTCDDGYFHLLTVLRTEACVFPKLRVLEWSNLRDTSLLHLFLSPVLRRCALPVFHSDLKSIATSCPLLENLSILTPAAHISNELSLLSDIIRSYKWLVDLRCPHLDFAAWKHLSNLPTLLTVRIHERDIHHPMDWDHLYSAHFFNLTTLTFCVNTSADVITVMQHSKFPLLQEFRLVVAVLSWVDAQQLFRVLPLCNACETLEHIEISSYNQGNDELSNMPFTAVGHFLCFSQLRSLRLSICYPIYVNNDLLLEAMSSWSHMRRLELRDALPTVTFRGLFTALRKCPHLHTLLLPMDAANIDVDSDSEAESFQHTSLRTWNVGDSYIEDPGSIARIIFSMLPSIGRIDYDAYALHPWHEVNKSLDALAARRSLITEAAPTT
ncbi:hypothetical protein K503DRAFT_777069 [Rhizopogon vinicolor AM-OR11-026]|uniref:F-box domain-containing protein n=1 Tax=Rhizopogon vinicolor AM-OR11-026 TaxID=1314800 RepID=A0A1B7MHG2_9AGAM|nr:hypothetical protein K503DRAFT_777069 [Rhizopogon vinicolor AM-OR11-026]